MIICTGSCFSACDISKYNDDDDSYVIDHIDHTDHYLECKGVIKSLAS